ncbi:MAG: adenylosuccinate lyase [Candidatus Thermoplasmatota archaeon]|nr:adenylosuccinate lyase [Euryarchaeota archaeon]MEC7058737.1 adenylosuccinate lyase [Candidatus Thermoplasmatota archaeon]MAP79422.1 adenylosuccinate lyase [Euryarchaeota archaeon]MEC7064971.1 adenylosuccinate lyase [Candidatus Thermoplasmatota archaeon]MEC7350911.1 adenylosuccinate lyase [Candidatus Thermoplasmatota archaeon]
MAFCPLDYRYGCEDFKRIWSELGRHERQLEVERALIWAHWQLGRVSEDDYNAVAAIANPESVTKERVSEIEAETRHDIMALTKAMAEAAGEAGWCIHLGATSNDIVDTAVGLQLRDSIVLLRQQLCHLISVCADVAERERDTVMLGRTHGQAAVPITFGLKAAVWLDELRRQLIRLDEAAPRVAVGKFLGAVGTGAAQGEHARELQRLILTHLGLGVPLATTQVVGRDRYVEYMSWLANIATSCEKILQEIRNLQRSELAEAGEGFDVKKQVGSSTMAHKKNPIKSENASGLARIVRSFIIPTYENALLWHERDLANSSSERFTLSHASTLAEDVMAKTADVLTNMWVDKDRCLANIHSQKGLVMAEKVMIELVDHGVPRDEAHEVLREASFTALANDEELIDVCSRTPAISAAFSAEELEAMFDPMNHVGVAGEIVDECVALAREAVQ